jgi:hypothetical protein
MTTRKSTRASKKPKPAYEPTWDAESGPSDEQINTALRVLRAEYWTSVRAMAGDIVERMRSGAEVSEVIHEQCDECYWTTYTAASQRAVLCSDCNWASECEDMGLENPTDEQRAYVCLSHDVSEQVAALESEAQ